jgi:hypothetical protein
LIYAVLVIFERSFEEVGRGRRQESVEEGEDDVKREDCLLH